MNVNER